MSDEKTIKVAKIEKFGEKIIIPTGMDFDSAIRNLREAKERDEQETRFSETIESAFPWDGAYATALVLDEKYGYVCGKPSPGFFSSNPPEVRYVPSGPNGQTTAVPWGRLTVPSIEGFLQLGATVSRGRLCFTINGVVKRKHEAQLKEIGELIRKKLKTDSLFRGKVFTIQFTNEEGDALDPESIEPAYLDVSDVVPEELVLPKETNDWFQDYFLTHIRYPKAAKDLGVPGKWGALLEGPPGTGKTMGIQIASKLATEMGVTVIYVNNFSDFEPAVRMAVQYQPSMLVMEDLDRLVSVDEDDKKLTSRVQNIMDGIESKNADVRLVFTSNFAEKLTNTIIRPGRIDLMIPFEAPDTEAAKRLITLYSRDLLAVADRSLDIVGPMLDGQLASSIRGVVEKAKLAAINRAKGNIKNLLIRESDLISATNSMKKQMDLLKRKEKPILSEREKAALIHIRGLRSLRKQEANLLGVASDGSSTDDDYIHKLGNGDLDEEDRNLLDPR